MTQQQNASDATRGKSQIEEVFDLLHGFHSTELDPEQTDRAQCLSLSVAPIFTRQEGRAASWPTQVAGRDNWPNI